MATASGRSTTVIEVTKDAATSTRAVEPSPRAHSSGAYRTVLQRLYDEPYAFDFFQASRLLHRLSAKREVVGATNRLDAEPIRFRSHLSLNFPPSAVFNIERPAGDLRVPRMVVTFFGLFGPSGILPRHYTELLLRLERDSKGPERYALRDWFDLFNHRLTALFYRAWVKYRFWVLYEQRYYEDAEPDTFTQSLYSLVGLGTKGLRKRLRVIHVEEKDGERSEKAVARVQDLAILYFAGYFSRRVRSAVCLQAMIRDYFHDTPVDVVQFQGQWLQLEPHNQSQLGAANAQLGVDCVAGQRVWDVQSKIRMRVGPIGYRDFLEFLPDRTNTSVRKRFFELCHLVRLYVGPELDFDVQLLLKAREVPACQLPIGGDVGGPQLGWNTWIGSESWQQPAADAVFAGEEVIYLNNHLGSFSAPKQ